MTRVVELKEADGVVFAYAIGELFQARDEFVVVDGVFPDRVHAQFVGNGRGFDHDTPDAPFCPGFVKEHPRFGNIAVAVLEQLGSRRGFVHVVLQLHAADIDGGEKILEPFRVLGRGFHCRLRLPPLLCDPRYWVLALEFVEKHLFAVIPAQAGIPKLLKPVDSCLRRNDEEIPSFSSPSFAGVKWCRRLPSISSCTA